MPLSNAKIGGTYKIVKITCADFVKKRLADFGVLPGATLKVVGRAPLGEPLEIVIRGYPLSLRANEASCIYVEVISES
jgi:Fe2+ transport system protein FeoA